ncbi:hypothetical protein GUF76_22305 [Xanthomonas citri pv. citri]|nr:hypothetical protein [Xanthomonas citri pv. citri]
MPSPISIATLASAGALRTVQLVGQVGGYAVMVRVGQTEKQLTGQRGEPRVFASLDTAAAQLLALGVMVFEVLPANYVRAPQGLPPGAAGRVERVGQAPARGQTRQAHAGQEAGRRGGGGHPKSCPATGRS